MNSTERDELLETLRELTAAAPDVRFGQLVQNLAYLARGPANESVWDVEDEELLRAARRQLAQLRQQSKTPAA